VLDLRLPFYRAYIVIRHERQSQISANEQFAALSIAARTRELHLEMNVSQRSARNTSRDQRKDTRKK